MEHDGGTLALASSRVIATWPKGSFAENVAVAAGGAIYVTLHTDNAIVRIDPGSGSVAPFATFDRPVTGLAFAADGSLIASGGAPGQAPGVIWRVTPNGAVALVAEIADAAFLNGVTPLGDRFLVADSLGAVIYAVEPSAGTVTRWLADPLLASPDAGSGPGANGIKLFGGHATISVTGADRLVRTPVAGGEAGRLEIVAERLRADDFAFDEDGALYLATHPAQSLMRLAPDGRRTTLAGSEQGMVGATAVAFGRGEDDRHSLYVTTTGGVLTVPDDKLEQAKLVRVDVGRPGHALLGSRR